jgi:hypothetical protein
MKMKLHCKISKVLMRRKSWDMKRPETPAKWLEPMDLTMFGLTLAALIRQAAQSSPKQSIPCIVGTKNLLCAMYILLMCRRMLLIAELEL